jgi:signal peptidase II
MTTTIRRGIAPATWIAMLAVLLVDLLTKEWALNRLTGGRTIDVLWTLRFNLHFNTGIAFSQLTGFGEIVGVVAIVVAAVLLWWSRKQQAPLVLAAIGLIVGGALGNVVDRVFRGEGWMHGAVVDFIDFQWFPIFNVADMGVTVGASLLVLSSFRSAS